MRNYSSYRPRGIGKHWEAEKQRGKLESKRRHAPRNGGSSLERLRYKRQKEDE